MKRWGPGALVWAGRRQRLVAQRHSNSTVDWARERSGFGVFVRLSGRSKGGDRLFQVADAGHEPHDGDEGMGAGIQQGWNTVLLWVLLVVGQRHAGAHSGRRAVEETPAFKGKRHRKCSANKQTNKIEREALTDFVRGVRKVSPADE